MMNTQKQVTDELSKTQSLKMKAPSQSGIDNGRFSPCQGSPLTLTAWRSRVENILPRVTWITRTSGKAAQHHVLISSEVLSQGKGENKDKRDQGEGI